MSTTESLHKQCRTLESLFDNKLTTYSRLAAIITRPGSHDLESTGSLERWQDLEIELEELLQKVHKTLAWVIQFLILSGGCSWERSMTSLTLCRMTRAVNQRRRCYAPFRGTGTCTKTTSGNSVGLRFICRRVYCRETNHPTGRRQASLGSNESPLWSQERHRVRF